MPKSVLLIHSYISATDSSKLVYNSPHVSHILSIWIINSSVSSFQPNFKAILPSDTWKLEYERVLSIIESINSLSPYIKSGTLLSISTKKLILLFLLRILLKQGSA